MVYCCGFGAQAACIARGAEYTGEDSPCEVRIVTNDDGSTSCEGLGNESGNLEACPCESEWREVFGTSYSCK